MAKQFRYLRGAVGTEPRACSCPSCAASQPANLVERHVAGVFGWSLPQLRRFVAGFREHPDVLREFEDKIRTMVGGASEPPHIGTTIESARATSDGPASRTARILSYLGSQPRPIGQAEPTAAASAVAPEPADLAAAIRGARGGVR